MGAAAYIARCDMADARIGRSFNYRQTTGLLAHCMVNWQGTAEDLWNAAEAAENRCNARVARELRPALPAELRLDDQRRLVHGFSLWLRDRFGVAVHYALHAPSFHDKDEERRLSRERTSEKGNDAYLAALADPAQTNLNFHAHILFTTRRVDRETGAFGEKTWELDRRKPGPENLLAIRQEWEKRTNAALARTGSRARIDLRSYEEMAADGDAPDGLVAQPHMGPRETAKARKRASETSLASKSRIAAERERVKSDNEARWSCWMQLRALHREKARLEESARIAEERERERRQRAEDEKRRIAEAESVAAKRQAVEDATTLEVPRGGKDNTYTRAIAAVLSEGVIVPDDQGISEYESEPDAAEEFDKEIDPETFTPPDLGEGDNFDPIVKPVKRKPPPGNFQRTRG
ncbi:MAG: MobA/MobL family protein [Coleofasciculus sp. C1-SOL-03]